MPSLAVLRSGVRGARDSMGVVARCALLVMLAVAVAGCSSTAPPFDAAAVVREWAAFMQRDYVICPGDRLTVRVEQVGIGSEADNAQEVVVAPTGTIDLHNLEAPLQVAGKSIGSMRNLIVEAYKDLLTQDPQVNVHLTEASAQSVFVCGEVRAPGALVYRPGLTLTQAVAGAGGFQITVCYTDIRVLRIGPDGGNRTFRINMDAVFHEGAPDFLLLPGDVVYLQTSGIADAGNWVELYIRRLLPFGLGGPSVTTIYN
jgi:protein involved in polysaccharide export with SLBB domain